MISLCPQLRELSPTLKPGYLLFTLEPSSGPTLQPAARTFNLDSDCDEQAPANVEGSRRLFKACGVDPSRYRPSADALRRRVAVNNAFPAVSPIVDVNNYLSLKYGICVGSYDLAAVSGPIVMRIGKADERYTGFSGKSISLHGMPLLSDEQSAFGSLHADSTRTAVSAQSRHLIMVFFHTSDTLAAEQIASEGRALLAERCQLQTWETGGVQ